MSVARVALSSGYVCALIKLVPAVGLLYFERSHSFTLRPYDSNIMFAVLEQYTGD
jgi:hypothetical protein